MHDNRLKCFQVKLHVYLANLVVHPNARNGESSVNMEWVNAARVCNASVTRVSGIKPSVFQVRSSVLR